MIRYGSRPKALRAMNLTDVLETQFFKSVPCHADTKGHYRRAVRWLGEAIGRTATVADMTDDHVAAMMIHLRDVRQQSAATVNGSHKCLVRLWRWMRDRPREYKITDGPTVKPWKVPKRAPNALGKPELTRLLLAAHRSPGAIGGLPARVWWLTLFGLEWDTGVRAGELLSVRWEWIDWSRGYFTVPAEYRKGSMADEQYGLFPDTLEWLSHIRKPRGVILQCGKNRCLYYPKWNDLLERAGLPPDRHHKTHCLRRTFATWLKIGGGNPQDALGHQSFATTMKYLDKSLNDERRFGKFMPFRLLSLLDESAQQEVALDEAHGMETLVIEPA